MKLHTLGPVLIVAFSALAGCGSVNRMMGGNSASDALARLQWSYAQDAVQVEWFADRRLNFAQGQPHALVLVVVQMKEPGAFAPYAAAPDKLAQLLSASDPPPGLLALTTLFVQPGEHASKQFARVEGARYVGIGAGYAQMDAARATKLYSIGVRTTSSGWFVKQRVAAPAPLTISLRLGPSGFLSAVQQASEPPASQPAAPASEIPVPRAASDGTGYDASPASCTATQDIGE